MAGLDTYPPRLNHMHTNFIHQNGRIYFGMRHIKNVGTKECDKIQEIKKDRRYYYLYLVRLSC